MTCSEIEQMKEELRKLRYEVDAIRKELRIRENQKVVLPKTVSIKRPLLVECSRKEAERIFVLHSD